MKQNLLEIVTQLIETAWRRRYLLAVPILVMLPLSIIGSRFLPQTYVTKALLAMQESGSDNPLIKAAGTHERIRDRAPGLQALLKSDRVLVNALRDILGDQMPTDHRSIAMARRDLENQLSFEMIGTDFLEFQLKGSNPSGLGRKLEAITSRFLESLVSPEQDALSATQVLLEKRHDDVVNAEKALMKFKEQLGERAIAAIAANDARLREAQASVQTFIAESAASDSEIGALKAALGAAAAAENAGRRESEIRQATLAAEALEKRGPNAAPEAQAQRLRVGQLTQLQALEARGALVRREIERLGNGIADQTRASTDGRSPEGQLRRLEREVAEARELEDGYKRRFPAATSTRSLQVLNAPERIRVIDAPRDPEFPATSRLKFVIAGLMSGLLLAAGLAGCAEMLDQRLRRAADFEAVAGVPVIARLPSALIEPDPDDQSSTGPAHGHQTGPPARGPRPVPGVSFGRKTAA